MSDTVHKFTFGEYTGYIFWEGSVRLAPTSVVFAGADKEVLKRELDKHNIAIDGIDIPVHVLLLEHGMRRILIDTGAGFNSEENGLGQLQENMMRANISPQSITDIIITHVHFDHTGGLLDEKGLPAFPNAIYWMNKSAYQHWAVDLFEDDPSARNDKYTLDTHNAILAIKPQTNFFEPPAEILSGIKILPTYGHTNHHISIQLESNGETLLISSDTLVNEIHVDHPDWIPKWSTDQDDARQSTTKILKLASDENTLLYACHFKFPGLGRVTSDDAGFKWISIT